MKIKSSEIVHVLRTGADNPRNSEGAFARLKNGNILFAYSKYHGGSWLDEAPSDIAALTLTPDGRALCSETPEILVCASEYENVSNIMSVSLLRMENGDLGLFYMVRSGRPEDLSGGSVPMFSDYVLRRSADDATFPKETETLCTSSVFKTYNVINNDRVLKTSGGRLIVPYSRHRGAYTPEKMRFDGIGHIKLIYSDDDGFTWREAYGEIACPFTAHAWNGFQEPGVAELPCGALYLYIRTERMCQYEAFSPDGGLTWSPAQPSGFTSPVSPMKMARNPYSGLYYAVWNPIPNYNGREIAPTTMGRTPLVMAESADGINFDFSGYEIIEGDPTRGFCYPAVFFLSEKEMLLSYCSGYPEEGSTLCSTTIRRITLE